jgi:hypothetical protein
LKFYSSWKYQVALQYISQADTGTATVTLGTFLPGDLAVFFAYRNASITVPSANAGCTDISSTAGANTNSRRTAWRLLQSGDAAFAFTNATAVQVQIWRGAKFTGTGPIGANSSGGSNTTTVTQPSLTVNSTNGTAALIAFGGTKATDANSKTLSGFTTVSGTTTALGSHYLTGNTANLSATNWSARRQRRSEPHRYD